MIKESERKGIAQGTYQVKVETAKNLVARVLLVENSAKATGLNQEEVEKL